VRAFLSIKYHPDGGNRARIEGLSEALLRAGMDTFCVARDLEQWGQSKHAPDELMRRTFHEIDLCQLVVLDLAEKGVGVGIEAGYAHARGIPVIVVAPLGSDISETLRGIAREILRYADVQDLGEAFARLAA
jgi:2'-deoxynucleoside 5'-phosphate N-hydrolase